ncbi:MAG: hypothetical protein NWE98_00360 [Candidatus Bathyarchaeota archaeon]|nr:hypothetical protein [Candidatus Bathyarchaeota archaeon]
MTCSASEKPATNQKIGDKNMQKTTEKIGWKANWQIYKFQDPKGQIAKEMQNGLPTEEALHRHGEAFIGLENFSSNLALNEGLQELIDLICGLGTPTKWDNNNARIGVGDSNIAVEATQTGLQAVTNKAFKAMDSNYPQRSNQTVEWRATFGGSDANFAWEEYTVVNAADDSGKNLNRKVASKGTKAAGETWTLSLQITFS